MAATDPETERNGLPPAVRFALVLLAVLLAGLALAALLSEPGGQVHTYEGFN